MAEATTSTKERRPTSEASSGESIDESNYEILQGDSGAMWDEPDHDWDLASNATASETGPGPDCVVPYGVIGAEYRTMKGALSQEAGMPRGATPHRDPYHGRITDPKCARRESPAKRAGLSTSP